MVRKMISTAQSKKKKLIRTILRYVFLVLAIIGFVYVMNQPYFFVKEVSIQGQQSLSEQDLSEYVESYLSESWLGIIPRRNILFLGRSTLSRSLEEYYPKIYNTEVTVDVTHLSVVITEREAHSLWCVDREYESLFDEECYFADQHGYWYARAPYFSDNVFLKAYIAPGLTTIQLGEQFMGGSSFDDLFNFVGELENDYGMEAQKIVFKPQQDLEIQLKSLDGIVFKEKPVIVLNTKESYKQMHRNIGIVLDQAEFKDDFQSEPQDLRSIDIRFNDRIFYLFSEGV